MGSTLLQHETLDNHYAALAPGPSGQQLVSPSYAAATSKALQVIDNTDGSNGGTLLQITHYGAADQSGGLDVKNFPGALTAVRMHQYARAAAGNAFMEIDNTDSGDLIILRNTENSSNNPNGSGFGKYFNLYGYKNAHQYNDGATTSGQPYLDSAMAGFVAGDKGKGSAFWPAYPNFPAGTTIAAVISATRVQMSANATATATGQTFYLPRASDVGSLFYLNALGQWINNQDGTGNISAQPFLFQGPQNGACQALKVFQPAGSSTAMLIQNSGSGVCLNIQNAAGNVFQIDNSGNVVAPATAGIKIGTATTQKLGFFNATPVVQPSGTPAASTDLATVIALANSLRTNLLALGLVA